MLTDAQWERIAPLLPGRPGTSGGRGRDNRHFVEAVLWLAGFTRRVGQLALDVHPLPALGTQWRVGTRLCRRPAGRRVAHAAGRLDQYPRTPAWQRRTQKNGPQRLGRSRGGLITKVHAASDARGRPVRLRLSPGQAHDAPQALPLLEGLAPQTLIADRAYDSDQLVAELTARGTQVVIPPRRKRRYPRAYDRVRYAQRQPIERLFSRLKQFRRLATRYDKLDSHFLAFIQLAATVLWLRDC